MSRPISVDSKGGGLYVDVGEPQLFYVEIDEARRYTMLSSSDYSVVVKVDTFAGEEIVLRVAWSKYKRVAHGKGYIGMEDCSRLPFVPDLHTSTLNILGNTYVSLITRQYMPGVPLSEVWSVMNESERACIKRDVQSAMEHISMHRSDMFMDLQGRNLSTPDPVNYINYRILLSKITRDLNESDMAPILMDTFTSTPVLCHQDLSMDHVLIDKGKLSGIVGWGRCDYVPEVFDRLRYYFIPPLHEGEREWYSFISRLPLVYPPPPPLYSVACMYYHYNLRRNYTSPDYHGNLERSLEAISDSLLKQVSAGTGDLCSNLERDHRSHEPHEYTSQEQPSEYIGLQSQPESEKQTAHKEDPFSDVVYPLPDAVDIPPLNIGSSKGPESLAEAPHNRYRSPSPSWANWTETSEEDSDTANTVVQILDSLSIA